MPLTPQQFSSAVEQHLAEVSGALSAFLRTHHLAYSADELAQELGLDGRDTFAALVGLADAGELDEGIIDGTTYFIYRAA